MSGGQALLPRPVVRVTRVSSSRDVWLKARLQGLGGSDLKAIQGGSRFRTAWEVWAEKTGRLRPEPTSERMRWGQLLEDTVAREWAGMYGVTVRRMGMVADPHRPWRLASVDRVTLAERGSLRADGLVEVKTASDRSGDLDDDALLARYADQVQWYLGLTGLERAWLPVLVGGQTLRELQLDADPERFAQLAELADRFWHDHVLADRPPPVVPGDNQAARRLHATSDAGPMVADDELAEVVMLRRQLDRDIAQLMEVRDECDAQVRAAMGGSSELITADGTRLATHRQQNGARRLDQTRLRHDLGVLAEAYETRAEPTRVLRYPKPKGETDGDS